MSRRKLYSLITAALGIAGCLSAKPDIVLIFAGDLGRKDTSFAGHDFHEKPRIDRLASEGMAFSNGYAAKELATPTRQTR